jgi:hypothetical protein
MVPAPLRVTRRYALNMGSKPAKSDKSLMRSLGEFFGHIARGVKTPVDAPTPPPQPKTRQVKKEVEEETRDTPTGRVTLRRTTVEEIVIHPDEDQNPPRSDTSRRQE